MVGRRSRRSPPAPRRVGAGARPGAWALAC